MDEQTTHVPSTERSIAQMVFIGALERMRIIPAADPSEHVLEDLLSIVNLYPQYVGEASGRLTTDQLRDMERVVNTSMYDGCKWVINSPVFNQLITTLKLTSKKASSLSLRKLGTLLTMEMVSEPGKNPRLHLTQQTEYVGQLLQILEDSHISFEELNAVDDLIFQIIVFAAFKLVSLSRQNVSLHNLLSLGYLQIWALAQPVKEHELSMVTDHRQQAMDLLNNTTLRYHS